jgi:mannan endo-1,4-beta-mannosidase
MKANLQLPLLASLAAGSVLPRDGYGTNGSAIGENDFVYVDGLRLYDSNGLHYLTGNTAFLYSKTYLLTMLKE